MATTPVSKYETVEDWYKDFKKVMRMRIKSNQMIHDEE